MSTFEAPAAEKLTATAIAAEGGCLCDGNEQHHYRFVHLASNKECGAMSSRPRMNVIGNPGWVPWRECWKMKAA
ncbi:hypothetical protein [Bradyrhizobium diazoefficiens]|uniref:hypothetical protein n=1 Tax=Bradyrhizobium diazoefficiens TaxID=1355477 RepID=UPI003D9ABD1D